MGRSEQRAVHPDRLVERSRQWSRGAVATAGAATLGLAGWIAVSTQTASAATTTAHTHSARTSTPTTTSTDDNNSSDDNSSSNSSSSSSSSSSTSSQTPQTPQISNSVNNSTPVQGTTSGS